MVSGSSHVYTDPAGTREQTYYPGAVFPFDDNENIKDSLKTFNAGVILFVGFSYNVGKGKIFIEGGGNYGFLNIQKVAADGKNETGAATAAIGYSIWLGK